MLPSRDEFQQMQKSIRTNGHDYDVKMVQQAAVKAELLTGDPVWDLFLTYLQHTIEETEAYRQSAQNALIHPSIVGHHEMLQAKIALAECNARITILKAVVSLPKDLIEMGTKAKGLLERGE
jgi:hypothetical protein